MIERYRQIKAEKAAGEREDGFTLIELLIVIVVLGILAAVVVFALGSVTGQSAVASCKADAKTVETGIAAFEAQNPGTAVTWSYASSAYSSNLLNATSATPAGTLKSWPTNGSHYVIGLGQVTGAPVDEVDIAPNVSTPPAAGNAAWVKYDTEGALGCAAVN